MKKTTYDYFEVVKILSDINEDFRVKRNAHQLFSHNQESKYKVKVYQYCIDIVDEKLHKVLEDYLDEV